MLLDAVHQDNPRCPRCERIQIDWKPARRLAKAHHFHTGADGHTHRALVNPQPGQEGPLPLCRSAAVAAHRREDKGHSPTVPNQRDDGLQYCWQAGDPSTASSYGDLIPRANARECADTRHLLSHGSGNIPDDRLLPRLSHQIHAQVR